MWSSVSIPGRPRILMVDGSGNRLGWESEFCERLYQSMSRRRLGLAYGAPARLERPEEMARYLDGREDVNSIFLFAHLTEGTGRGGADFRGYWDWLGSLGGLTPKLLVACTWDDYDGALSEDILKRPDSFAPLAVVQQSPVTDREAGLFFLKFFTELDLHSADDITGRMVWFSVSKARELLRRRRLKGKFGLRC